MALGRWLAIVLVWGGTHSGRLPHTLCRPWEIGSSRLATMPEQRVEDRRRARQLAGARHHEAAGPIVQERGVVDPQPARR